MIIIQQLYTELNTAEAFEAIRIAGYRRILAFPEGLISAEAAQEVNEALQWSIQRLANITSAILEVSALIEHGYPSRVQQIAPLDVINELNQELDTIRLAVAEFETAPVGTVTVSEEIALN